MENKKYCAECEYFSTDEMRCTNPNGTFFKVGVITEQVSEADNDCPEFKEVRYKLTPLGILTWAMEHNGVKVNLDTAKKIFEDFVESMQTSGYLKIDEEDKDNDCTGN